MTAVRALIYARFSPRGDADECESVRGQALACQALADARGWGVVGVWFDREVSRNVRWFERPGMSSMMAHVRKADRVLAFHLDRIGSGLAAAEIIADIEKRAAVLVRVQGDTSDLDSDSRYMVDGVSGIVSEMERRRIRARVVSGVRLARADGRCLTRSDRAPFGWSVVGRKLVPIEAEQAWLAKIIEWHGAGLGYRRIAARLAESGVPTRTGGGWSASGVRSILARAAREAAAR